MMSFSALLVVGVAIFYYFHCHHEMDAIVGCVNDDSTGCYFSNTYWEARSRFRAATAEAGWELESVPISEGSPFTIDFAYKPAKGPVTNTIVHLSGTHGVEGYAGSAIQLKYLKNWKEGNAQEGTSVLLVHVMNPYGMAYDRRWNENNVDLNRNGIYDSATFEELKARDPNIAGYFDQDSLINPNHAPSLSDAYVVFLKAAFSIAQHGFGALKRALVAAQYVKPEGIFYGGSELQPSYKILRRVIESKKLHETSGRVTIIDVHTGLGPKGVDTLLVDDHEAFVLAGRQFDISQDPSTKIEALDGSNDASQAAGGYELTKGVNSHAMKQIFTKSKEFLGICQEFGTQPGVLVARALILENMAYHYDREHQPYWSQYTRDAFYCRDESWRAAILRRGIMLLSQSEK